MNKDPRMRRYIALFILLNVLETHLAKHIQPSVQDGSVPDQHGQSNSGSVPIPRQWEPSRINKKLLGIAIDLHKLHEQAKSTQTQSKTQSADAVSPEVQGNQHSGTQTSTLPGGFRRSRSKQTHSNNQQNLKQQVTPTELPTPLSGNIISARGSNPALNQHGSESGLHSESAATKTTELPGGFRPKAGTMSSVSKSQSQIHHSVSAVSQEAAQSNVPTQLPGGFRSQGRSKTVPSSPHNQKQTLPSRERSPNTKATRYPGGFQSGPRMSKAAVQEKELSQQPTADHTQRSETINLPGGFRLNTISNSKASNLMESTKSSRLAPNPPFNNLQVRNLPGGFRQKTSRSEVLQTQVKSTETLQTRNDQAQGTHRVLLPGGFQARRARTKETLSSPVETEVGSSLVGGFRLIPKQRTQTNGRGTRAEEISTQSHSTASASEHRSSPRTIPTPVTDNAPTLSAWNQNGIISRLHSLPSSGKPSEFPGGFLPKINLMPQISKSQPQNHSSASVMSQEATQTGIPTKLPGGFRSFRSKAVPSIPNKQEQTLSSGENSSNIGSPLYPGGFQSGPRRPNAVIIENELIHQPPADHIQRSDTTNLPGGFLLNTASNPNQPLNTLESKTLPGGFRLKASASEILQTEVKSASVIKTNENAAIPRDQSQSMQEGSLPGGFQPRSARKTTSFPLSRTSPAETEMGSSQIGGFNRLMSKQIAQETSRGTRAGEMPTQSHPIVSTSEHRSSPRNFLDGQTPQSNGHTIISGFKSLPRTPSQNNNENVVRNDANIFSNNNMIQSTLPGFRNRASKSLQKVNENSQNNTSVSSRFNPVDSVRRSGVLGRSRVTMPRQTEDRRSNQNQSISNTAPQPTNGGAPVSQVTIQNALASLSLTDTAPFVAFDPKSSHLSVTDMTQDFLDQMFGSLPAQTSSPQAQNTVGKGQTNEMVSSHVPEIISSRVGRQRVTNGPRAVETPSPEPLLHNAQNFHSVAQNQSTLPSARFKSQHHAIHQNSMGSGPSHTGKTVIVLNINPKQDTWANQNTSVMDANAQSNNHIITPPPYTIATNRPMTFEKPAVPKSQTQARVTRSFRPLIHDSNPSQSHMTGPSRQNSFSERLTKQDKMLKQILQHMKHIQEGSRPKQQTPTIHRTPVNTRSGWNSYIRHVSAVKNPEHSQISVSDNDELSNRPGTSSANNLTDIYRQIQQKKHNANESDEVSTSPVERRPNTHERAPKAFDLFGNRANDPLLNRLLAMPVDLLMPSPNSQSALSGQENLRPSQTDQGSFQFGNNGQRKPLDPVLNEAKLHGWDRTRDSVRTSQHGGTVSTIWNEIDQKPSGVPGVHFLSTAYEELIRNNHIHQRRPNRPSMGGWNLRRRRNNYISPEIKQDTRPVSNTNEAGNRSGSNVLANFNKAKEHLKTNGGRLYGGFVPVKSRRGSKARKRPKPAVQRFASQQDVRNLHLPNSVTNTLNTFNQPEQKNAYQNEQYGPSLHQQTGRFVPGWSLQNPHIPPTSTHFIGSQGRRMGTKHPSRFQRRNHFNANSNLRRTPGTPRTSGWFRRRINSLVKERVVPAKDTNFNMADPAKAARVETHTRNLGPPYHVQQNQHWSSNPFAPMRTARPAIQPTVSNRRQPTPSNVRLKEMYVTPPVTTPMTSQVTTPQPTTTNELAAIKTQMKSLMTLMSAMQQEIA